LTSQSNRYQQTYPKRGFLAALPDESVKIVRLAEKRG
jgi:hypothetical protein